MQYQVLTGNGEVLATYATYREARDHAQLVRRNYRGFVRRGWQPVAYPVPMVALECSCGYVLRLAAKTKLSALARQCPACSQQWIITRADRVRAIAERVSKAVLLRPSKRKRVRWSRMADRVVWHLITAKDWPWRNGELSAIFGVSTWFIKDRVVAIHRRYGGVRQRSWQRTAQHLISICADQSTYITHIVQKMQSLGYTVDQVRITKWLKRLIEAGQVKRIGRGYYMARSKQ